MTEIFVEPELDNLQESDTAAEWFELASELGLQNQISLADKSEEKKAPPYMFIDPKTNNIIKALCPRRVDYKEYKESTIPLDILQEIAKCEKNGWYQKIQIAFDDKSPDPFVIGVLHAQYDWNAPVHLIARWGAELVPFEQLRMNAINRLRNATKKSLEQLRFRAEYGLKNIDDFIDGVLGGDEMPKAERVGSQTFTGSDLPF